MDYFKKLSNQELHYQSRYDNERIRELLTAIATSAQTLHADPYVSPLQCACPDWVFEALKDHLRSLEAVNLEHNRRIIP